MMAAAPFRLAQQLGFTLLEILVVLVIIAALAGLAVLTRMDNQPRQLHQAAEKLAAQMTLISDQAVLEGREYGLAIGPHSYQWFSYDSARQSWQSQVLPAPEQLAEGLQLSLKLEGQALSLSGAVDEPSEQSAPQILLLSNGELSPFSLQLRGDRGAQLQLSSDGFNLPSLSEPAP